VLRKLAGQVRPPLVVLVVGAGVLLSGCAIGFRVPATDITATSVTLNGYVGSNRSEQGEWWFEYGKTSALGTETPKRSIQFTEFTRHDITEPVTGLEPSTTYHLVLCADDQEPGVGEFCSAQQTFRTFADATADSIVATGNAGLLTNIDIDVSSGPGGENPTGHLAADTAQYGRLVASAITCVSVTGTTAAISGALEPNSSGSGGFRVTVIDDGPAGSGLDAVGGQLASFPPTDCFPFGGSTLFAGDAVVIDAGAP
jgi:hypothetical protein